MNNIKNDLNILFTSSGRRVSLIKKFRNLYTEYLVEGKIVTADYKKTAPTAFLSDLHIQVPRVSDEHYLDSLLQICREQKIDVLIPLIDTELLLLASNKEKFAEIGVQIPISSPELIQISNDKRETYRFFVEKGIPTPKVYTDDEITNMQYELPLIIKPLDGSASSGVTKIRNEKELYFFKDYISNAMIQEYVFGEEYTVDVMVDFKGNIKTVVPRLRIETRAGEVSKGVTKKDAHIIEAAIKVIQALPNPVGCITLQCFKKLNGEIVFIEINPRFGGGIPLSIEAGANFPMWTISICLGELFTALDLSWKEDMTMLRYDEAIFTESVKYAN